jgi:hypothetical protein
MNRYTMIDTSSLRVPTELITDFSICAISNSVWWSPSARCANAANNICQFLMFNRNTVSLDDILPLIFLLKMIFSVSFNFFILWHVDPLLGIDREISNYTTAVIRQWPVSSNKKKCFLCGPCRNVISRTSWFVELVRELLRSSSCEVLLIEAGS